MAEGQPFCAHRFARVSHPRIYSQITGAGIRNPGFRLPRRSIRASGNVLCVWSLFCDQRRTVSLSRTYSVECCRAGIPCRDCCCRRDVCRISAQCEPAQFRRLWSTLFAELAGLDERHLIVTLDRLAKNRGDELWAGVGHRASAVEQSAGIRAPRRNECDQSPRYVCLHVRNACRRVLTFPHANRRSLYHARPGYRLVAVAATNCFSAHARCDANREAILALRVRHLSCFPGDVPGHLSAHSLYVDRGNTTVSCNGNPVGSVEGSPGEMAPHNSHRVGGRRYHAKCRKSGWTASPSTANCECDSIHERPWHHGRDLLVE